MHLAKANFSNLNRVRYGRDYYDERMQASTRVLCTDEDSFRTIHLPTSEYSSSMEMKQADSRSDPDGDHGDLQQTSVEVVKAETKSEKQNRTSDPLNWFGILIPPALRVSQAAFQNAITMVPRLAALDQEMRALEIEIRRTRKKLSKLEP